MPSTRLVQEYRELRRSLRMSQHFMFVFVEGEGHDVSVYGEIAQSWRDTTTAKKSYQVIRAKEMTVAGSGGKQSLLAFHDYLRARNSLGSIGSYSTIFMLDKDADDSLRKLRRSQHIMYTITYDVEAMMYLFGNLRGAIISAYGVVPTDLSFLGTSERWCQETSERWLEWIAICLAAKRLEAPYPGYSRHESPINVPPHASTDGRLLEDHLNSIAHPPKLTRARVDEVYARCRSIAMRRERSSPRRALWLFRGKWYFGVLDSEIRSHLPHVSGRRPRRELEAALIATMDVSEPWAQRYVIQMEALATAFV